MKISVKEAQRRLIMKSGKLDFCVFCLEDTTAHEPVFNSHGCYVRCVNRRLS